MEQTIGLLKEPSFEKRVALLPPEVKKLVHQLETPVWIEENYATDYGISDGDYSEEGAEIKSRKDILKNATSIVSINDVLKPDESPPKNTDFIGIYNPKFFPKRIEKFTKSQAKVYSLD